MFFSNFFKCLSHLTCRFLNSAVMRKSRKRCWLATAHTIFSSNQNFVFAVQKVVPPPALITYPAIIYCVIWTCLNTHKLVKSCSHCYIAVTPTISTKRIRIGQIPCSCLETKVRVGQSTDRTNINNIAREASIIRFVIKCPNFVVKPTV